MSNQLSNSFNQDDASIEVDSGLPQIALGQWYWVNSEYIGKPMRWFGCVTHIGSNYLLLQQPRHDGSMTRLNSWSLRVHFKDFFTKLEFVDDPDQVIRDHVNGYSDTGNRLMLEIKEITMRLGLKTDGLIGNQQQERDTTGTGLAVLNEQHDIHAYKNALIEAKKETLPALFEQLKDAHAGVAQWMQAPVLIMNTTMNGMKESISEINNRIFNVSLYAGLDEHLVQCCEGEPADILEKLHIMQRKLYMDEECLLNYNAGGMEFKDIRDFDAWISLSENRDRILPFPRTLVAMQVRRNKKERDSELDEFIRMQLQKADEYTYLYLRNGDQVWRLTVDSFEFDSDIFPDRSVFDPSEPMMFKRDFSRVQEFMSAREYEDRLANLKKNEELSKQWALDNPDKDYYVNPYRSDIYSDKDLKHDWYKFDDSTVYYDDAVDVMAERMSKYNRISLLVQGLFDRSPVFAPHLPVKTWMPESFAKSIKLVYDSENVLYAGEKPDFEAYRAKCNASITMDSVLAGQMVYWMRDEAKKENARNGQRYRFSDRRYTVYTWLKPHGNPGMGYIAKPSNVSKNAVTFSWMRERANYAYGKDPMVKQSITIPKSELFNVSAYQVGDYKKFFNDPRTRSEYIKWAHLLLAAEDYHAGKHIDDNGDVKDFGHNEYTYR